MSSNLLLAVKSCHKHRVAGWNQIIRDTWGRHAYPDTLLFFHGEQEQEHLLAQKEDEIFLNCRDNYNSLPYKTQAILKFFLLVERWEWIFLCDVDTYVRPRELRRVGYENWDVSGRFGSHPEIGTTFRHSDDRGNLIENCHPWPSGGVGYFLSRKAAGIVVDTTPMTWAEDLYVGQATGPYIQRGQLKAVDIPDFEGQISWHFPRKLYNKQVYDPRFGWQQKMFREMP